MKTLIFDTKKFDVSEVTLRTVNNDFLLFYCDEIALYKGNYLFYIKDNLVGMMPGEMILEGSIKWN